MDISVYKNNTTNQVLELPIPIESGVQWQQINAGNIENKGVEISLNTVPVKQKISDGTQRLILVKIRTK